MIEIREIHASDAEAFLELSQQTDRETPFMLIEPNERVTTVEEERERINRILSSDNQVVLVAENDGQLVGRIVARGGDFRRNKRTAHVVVGILQSFTGQGIGQRLFVELERWARWHGIHRLELTVMVHNDRAVVLYKKMGFEIEGTKREALFVNRAYVDEYLMAKLLS
jgi:RimJ/RimL family protein N-acetyltransferase